MSCEYQLEHEGRWWVTYFWLHFEKKVFIENLTWPFLFPFFFDTSVIKKKLSYNRSLGIAGLKVDIGHLKVQLQSLGLVLLVNRLAKAGLFSFDIEPFDVTSAPKKRGKVKSGFTGTGPNGFTFLPPFGLTSRPFINVVKKTTRTLSAILTSHAWVNIRVSKLVADYVMVTRIQACNGCNWHNW
jgi:hypothetical protein